MTPTPRSTDPERGAALVLAIAVIVVVGLVAKILLGAVQTAVRRRESEGPATEVAPDVRKPDATERG